MEGRHSLCLTLPSCDRQVTSSPDSHQRPIRAFISFLSGRLRGLLRSTPPQVAVEWPSLERAYADQPLMQEEGEDGGAAETEDDDQDIAGL